MKILVAINATDWKTLDDRALRWCGRMGFDLRVFAAKNKRKRFLLAVENANYHYYLALKPNDTIITRMECRDYAQMFGYDLLVTVPEELTAWRKGSEFKIDEVKRAYETLASARGDLSRNPRKKIKRWANGVVMERIR